MDKLKKGFYTALGTPLDKDGNVIAESLVKEINMQIEKCRTQQINTESQKELIEKYTEFTQLDRNIADEFIDYIEIGSVTDDGNREIHIHWKI